MDIKFWCRGYVENFGDKYDETINSRLINSVTNQAELVVKGARQCQAKPIVNKY